MSIWNKCEKYGAVPFFGFPVIPKFEDDMIIFEFPEGYDPHGSETQRVAEVILGMIGKSIVEVTDKVVKVSIDNALLALFLHKQLLESGCFHCGAPVVPDLPLLQLRGTILKATDKIIQKAMGGY